MYPIRTVSKLTGLSLDTLRAWERRYGAVRPERGDRGRLYDEAAVARLRLLRDAVENGYAIGQVAGMEDAELRGLLESPAFAAAPRRARAAEARPGLSLRPVLDALAAFDAAAADQELGRLAAVLPPRDLVHRVVVPLLHDVGDGWDSGEVSIAQEHLTSGVLRNLLGTLVRHHAKSRPLGRLVFATPAGERHEFGILCAAMLAVGAGFGCVYLGTDLPASEIAGAAARSNAGVVVLGVTAREGEDAAAELRLLAGELPPRTELWVGGRTAVALGPGAPPARARVFADLEEYERALASL